MMRNLNELTDHSRLSKQTNKSHKILRRRTKSSHEITLKSKNLQHHDVKLKFKSNPKEHKNQKQINVSIYKYISSKQIRPSGYQKIINTKLSLAKQPLQLEIKQNKKKLITQVIPQEYSSKRIQSNQTELIEKSKMEQLQFLRQQKVRNNQELRFYKIGKQNMERHAKQLEKQIKELQLLLKDNQTVIEKLWTEIETGKKKYISLYSQNSRLLQQIQRLNSCVRKLEQQQKDSMRSINQTVQFVLPLQDLVSNIKCRLKQIYFNVKVDSINMQKDIYEPDQKIFNNQADQNQQISVNNFIQQYLEPACDIINRYVSKLVEKISEQQSNIEIKYLINIKQAWKQQNLVKQNINLKQKLKIQKKKSMQFMKMLSQSSQIKAPKKKREPKFNNLSIKQLDNNSILSYSSNQQQKQQDTQISIHLLNNQQKKRIAQQRKKN